MRKSGHTRFNEAHAKAALACTKQNGTKEEQKKLVKTVHQRYLQIRMFDYFMAHIILLISSSLYRSKSNSNIERLISLSTRDGLETVPITIKCGRSVISVDDLNYYL